tara:strand:+ start:173 stop:580 length:408 start_codon:yes stop_codon:yes gene_type:complete
MGPLDISSDNLIKRSKKSTPKKRKRSETKSEKAARERKERKAAFEKHQKNLKKKGQDKMTLKQRQADDEIKGRRKLIKSKKKVRWFGRVDKDEKKRIERMEKDVHRRKGTKKENLKAKKRKSTVSNIGGRGGFLG